MNIKNIFKKWFSNVTECILCLIAAIRVNTPRAIDTIDKCL